MAEKKYFNNGYLMRKSSEAVGMGTGSLDLWVNKVETKTIPSTGDVVLELSTSGTFNNNNNIGYCLGDDVYANNEGLMYVNVTAWGPKKDRLLKLNVGQGFRLTVYGEFKKETYTGNDGTPKTKVVCKDMKQFEVSHFPQNQNGTQAAPTQAAQPAPAPAPAPAQAAPVQVPQPAPVDAGVAVPF